MVVVPHSQSEVVRLTVASLADLAIRHLVSDGEAWMLVKIEPDFGHGGR
jgi:hypothetical protein